MPKAPFLKGQASNIGSSRKSRRHQQKEIEDGIKTIVVAVKELMNKPRAEREAHIEVLAAQLDFVGAKLEQLDPRSGQRRVAAAKKIMTIVKRASDAKP